MSSLPQMKMKSELCAESLRREGNRRPGVCPWYMSILKEINSEYSLEGLMLKLQYFGHLMRTANSLKKTLMPGKTDGRRRRGQEDEMVLRHH